MTSKYFNELDQPSQTRYLEKLAVINGCDLPDPLDDMVRRYTFSKDDMTQWPTIEFGDLFMYLVAGECVYTKEKFKNYKSLKCYNYFLSGKVTNILAYKNSASDVCIMTCDVQASQSLRIFHKPWIISSVTGTIYSGHCTCMAGLGEVCSHVAALLFTIEQATKEGLQSPAVTSQSCKWNKTMKKVKPVAAAKLNFFHQRKNPFKRAHVNTHVPSEAAYKKFIDLMKETNPDAPYLLMLSDDDTSTASETENQLKTDSNALTPERQTPEMIAFYRKLNSNIPKTVCETDRVNAFISGCTYSKEHILEIEAATRDQVLNPKWMDFRFGRITASLFGRVLRCKRGHDGIVSTIMQKKTFTNEAMRYGQSNEIKAKEIFQSYLNEQHVNGQFMETGFLIDEKYGFLGATPDGKVMCDCCETALVEIKCPSRAENKPLQEISKQNFFFGYQPQLKKESCLL